ncbi:uncharacterized protein TEOVI_000069800 [Trypanosoma equiperdum]|uniref:Nucleotide exchange factor Fes1 domain-containing protein n=2 Tax=Trypanozoon TaxID=39700 RepID=Q584B4_TRYB2|nr:hypothetical protein, conserved [Trypanosoma brucei brucei TREU927]AAX79799.1 hypothetical protein, conserved [Trypanosoma brucei]AAZ10928.1 hypothetical protein, conserved [Trypanosoma brucei brucei TREU927]SCU69141.1 hypothetical protein, conserved [Trypanosoma equiperdum]
MSSNTCINTALLDFCTRLDNGPKASSGESNLPKRSPEEMQWLREALASVEQPERKIRRILDAVAGEGLSEDVCLEHLEELSDMVEDTNWAVEFVLGGGHRIILDFMHKRKLAAGSAEIRQAAAMVVAHAAQLNERAQKCFEEIQWQSVLVPMLMKEEDPAVIAALLHACSCLCRDYAPNAQLFARADGVDIIKGFLDVDSIGSRSNDKIVKRVLFFLSYLAEVVTVDVPDLTQRIAAVIDSDDDEVQVVVARALLSLAAKNLSAVRAVLQEEKPGCLSQWQSQLLEDDDCRRQLMRVLSGDELKG